LNFKTSSLMRFKISRLMAIDVVNIMEYRSKVLQLVFNNLCMLWKWKWDLVLVLILDNLIWNYQLTTNLPPILSSFPQNIFFENILVSILKLGI
jgi:hypothetical protein